MTKNRVKVGIVGCGFITQNTHIPALRKCRNAEIVALCDSNEELARKVAQKFGIGKYYTHFDEMLEKERLDVVDICTPINTHAPLAIQAMNAGCHVLMEKPMALTASEANEVVTVSRKTHMKCCVIHNMLFLPTVLRMKSIVNEGTIGDLVRVEIKQCSPPQDFPPVADPTHWYHKLPGGIFGDNLPHPIYLMREFLGDVEPLAVYTSKVGSLEHLPVDEVQILLKGNRGLGTIISSCNWSSLWTIDILGTKMNVHGNLNNSYVIIYGGKTKAGKGIPTLYARENLNRALQILVSTLSAGIKLAMGKHTGHPILISKFIESVQNNKEPPVTAEHGRDVVRVWEKVINQVNAMRAKGDTNKRVI
ncbi:hypothetical protein DRO69_06130 [Candidatus Bathyarchaeota archaeon]|mgnify:CR=1 FL=1|nr:MAG: hypothetical protein DRO69_06130 [Candidatus Bathyarchaeota archaeon]